MIKRRSLLKRFGIGLGAAVVGKEVAADTVKQITVRDGLPKVGVDLSSKPDKSSIHVLKWDSSGFIWKEDL